MKNRPVELLEEALQILRGAGTSILIQYWTGAIPFGIALLLLLHDMSLSWGAELLLRDSFACAAAYLWLSYWKSRASRATMSLLTGEQEAELSRVNGFARQAIFQTMKLFVMPFAVASILGWPAGSALFRTLALGTSFRKAFTAATERYAENLLAFVIVAALTAIAYVNILIMFLAIPTLWKMLTGIETDWSRMAMAGASGIFAVAAVATWLLIDPWIQTYCLLRVFYLNARSDGRDLLRDIGRLAAMMLICLLAVSAPLCAEQTAQQRLDQSIDHVASSSGDYRWLRTEKDSSKSFLTELAQKIEDSFGRFKSWIQMWWHRLMRALTGDERHREDAKPAQPRVQELRWTLGVLAALICGGIVALFFRRGRIRAIKAGPAAGTNPVVADVLDENILPSEVQQEEWLRKALEYLANDETRLAARAFYLANLSYLGAQSLLSLSLWKSNRLYERELARQPKAHSLQLAFAAANRLYERAWYGMRELGADQVEALKLAVDQLREHA
jgi:hypothetical protein